MSDDREGDLAAKLRYGRNLDNFNNEERIAVFLDPYVVYQRLEQPDRTRPHRDVELVNEVANARRVVDRMLFLARYAEVARYFIQTMLRIAYNRNPELMHTMMMPFYMGAIYLYNSYKRMYELSLPGNKGGYGLHVFLTPIEWKKIFAIGPDQTMNGQIAHNWTMARSAEEMMEPSIQARRGWFAGILNQIYVNIDTLGYGDTNKSVIAGFDQLFWENPTVLGKKDGTLFNNLSAYILDNHDFTGSEEAKVLRDAFETVIRPPRDLGWPLLNTYFIDDQQNDNDNPYFEQSYYFRDDVANIEWSIQVDNGDLLDASTFVDRVVFWADEPSSESFMAVYHHVITSRRYYVIVYRITPEGHSIVANISAAEPRAQETHRRFQKLRKYRSRPPKEFGPFTSHNTLYRLDDDNLWSLSSVMDPASLIDKSPLFPSMKRGDPEEPSLFRHAPLTPTIRLAYSRKNVQADFILGSAYREFLMVFTYDRDAGVGTVKIENFNWRGFHNKMEIRVETTADYVAILNTSLRVPNLLGLRSGGATPVNLALFRRNKAEPHEAVLVRHFLGLEGPVEQFGGRRRENVTRYVSSMTVSMHQTGDDDDPRKAVRLCATLDYQAILVCDVHVEQDPVDGTVLNYPVDDARYIVISDAAAFVSNMACVDGCSSLFALFFHLKGGARRQFYALRVGLDVDDPLLQPIRDYNSVGGPSSFVLTSGQAPVIASVFVIDDLSAAIGTFDAAAAARQNNNSSRAVTPGRGTLPPQAVSMCFDPYGGSRSLVFGNRDPAPMVTVDQARQTIYVWREWNDIDDAALRNSPIKGFQLMTVLRMPFMVDRLRFSPEDTHLILFGRVKRQTAQHIRVSVNYKVPKQAFVLHQDTANNDGIELPDGGGYLPPELAVHLADQTVDDLELWQPRRR